MKMKIGIDARSLVETAGMARYLGNLLREWGKIAAHNRYILFLKENIDIPFLDQRFFIKKIANKPLLFRKDIVWEQLWLTSVLRNNQVDILFCPAYTAPLRTGIKIVLAIHDVSYEAQANLYPLRDRLKMRMLSSRAARKANKIITISDFSKKEIIKYYNVLPEKVKVTPLAADPQFKPQQRKEKLEEIKNKYGIRDKFILYVGAMSGVFARRNVPVLVSAFKEISSATPPCQLVLVGKHKSEIPQIIQDLKLEERVTLIDYVSDEDLVSLYNAADVFVYLSIYEGFGLPVLEAMACGAPVVCSSFSSLPEVAGDAAVFVNPTNPKEVAAALSNVLDDKELRTRLSNKSLEQARKFSWRKTAQAALQVLEETAKGKP